MSRPHSIPSSRPPQKKCRSTAIAPRFKNTPLRRRRRRNTTFTSCSWKNSDHYEDFISNKEILHHQLQTHKLEALGALARGVSHELNNILMAISGFTDLALAHTESNRIISYLEHIREAYSRAESLVRQLHFFSRTEQNGTEPLHIDLLINEAVKTLRAGLPKTVKIHINLDARLHPVQGDPALLLQMVLQLLRNAAQAIPKEGGQIFVTANNIMPEDQPICSKRPEPDWIEIQIRDTGPDLSPDNQDRIYAPFFTTSPSQGRLGPGLAMVHGIARTHDGILSSHTVPGEGYTFRVLLPGAPPAPKSPALPAEQNTPRHVLIIDDQPSLLLMQQEGLEKHGFRATGCSTGEEGIQTYKRERHDIDIILVDYAMPDMNGLEVAEKIHALSPAPPPILLCTGFLPNTIRTSQTLPYITDILYKPISIKTLVARLRELPDTATKDNS